MQFPFTVLQGTKKFSSLHYKHHVLQCIDNTAEARLRLQCNAFNLCQEALGGGVMGCTLVGKFGLHSLLIRLWVVGEELPLFPCNK